MIRQIAIALLLGLLLAPVATMAKGYAPRSSEKEAPSGLEDGFFSREPLDTTSQEVTEVVTTESIPLSAIEAPVKKPSPDDRNGDLGIRNINLFPSEWAVFWRLAGYNPQGNNPSGSSILGNVGLRYKIPDKWGEYYQLAYEVSYNWWNGSSADLSLAEATIEVFAGGSPALRMEHHPYYGLGFGRADIDRHGSTGFSENYFSVVGGVEFPGRRLDWDVFAKYYYAPDKRYNLDDIQLGLGVVYTFGRGR